MYGESLLAAACFGVEAAGLTLLDPHLPWDVVVESALPLVLHDPLCPLTPVEFILEALDLAEQQDVVVVGVRPVTDTVRASVDGHFGETLDRETLWQVASPIVVPARVVAEMTERPAADFVEVVTAMRAYGEVRYLEGPPPSRRVSDVDGVRVLAALGAP